jgi:hypothetical protein
MICEHCSRTSLALLGQLAEAFPEEPRWLKLETRLSAHLIGPDWFVRRLQTDVGDVDSPGTLENATALRTDARWDVLEAHLGVEVFDEPAPNNSWGFGKRRDRLKRLARKAWRDPVLFLSHSRIGVLRRLGKRLS